MTIWSGSKGFAGKFRLGCRAAVMALLLVTAPSVTALGLGEITLNSSLNEPLDAEIVVLSSEGLESGQMLVSLASPEAFERAGVERDLFHTQMQFSVLPGAGEQYLIRIATPQPVVEPYLNFLVQLQWPAGRVMREYTLLLDLPIYSEDQQPLSASPALTSADTAAESAEQPATVEVLPNLQPISGDRHQVIAGDTLWNVAVRLRPGNTTILQTMDSLYRLNAEAFVDGDANRIKAGHVLRLPSYDEISREAGNTVAAQIGLRNPSLSVAELEFSYQPKDSFDNALQEDASVTSMEQEQSDDGRLELASAFSPGQGESDPLDSQVSPLDGVGETVGTVFEVDSTEVNSAEVDSAEVNSAEVNNAEAGQLNQLADELALANDEVNKARQENIELRERLALLEAQVATMAALLEQAENNPIPEAAAPAGNPATDSPAEQNLGQQLAAVPAYIWMLILAVILFLLVLLVRKSAREQESKALGDNHDLPLSSGYDEYDESDNVAATGQNDLQALDDLELDPDDNLFDETDEDIFDQDSSEEQFEESDEFDAAGEVVAEADVYLSLGKTAEAIEILEEARARDAADASSRLKLMEVLFRENRKDELAALYDEIKDTGDQSATEMAGIIMGPDNETESVAPLSKQATEQTDEQSVASELEGLDFQTTEYEDLGLGKLGLADLELDDLASEDNGEEFEDLDLENLTADDFDIEPADSLLDSGSEQDDLSRDNKDSEEPAVSLASEDPLDDFAEFDNVDEQGAVDVKLDLAKTYLEMGDSEGAREILDELIEDADEEGAARARAMLEALD